MFSPKFVASSALCLTLLASLGHAHAAVYRGILDPEYGVPFDTTGKALAWRGSLTVTVNDACVPQGQGQVTLLNCAGGLQINEASIDVYNMTTNATQTMNFGAAAGLGFLGLNWALQFDANSDLIGANSTAFPAIQGAIDATEYNGQQAWFSLQFLGNYGQLYWFAEQPSAAELLYLTAKIGNFGGICRENGVKPVSFLGDDNLCGWSDPDNISQGSFIRFTRVSEPATLALVPVALGLMGLVAVKARRRAAMPAA